MTTTKQIQAFNFDTHAVRVVNQGDQPWFVALDVCNILGHTNSQWRQRTWMTMKRV